MKLREHQLFGVDLSRKSLARNQRSILNAATGYGKTVTASYICDLTLQRGNTVIVLVHRIEILKQFASTMARFHLTPSLIVAGKKIQRGHQLYLGMVDTFRSRMRKIPNLTQELGCDLLICDEVHWGSYEKVINGAHCKVLGLSATPKAASGMDLNKYMDDCVCPITVSELIQQGYLCEGKTYSFEYDFSKVKMSGKDFNTEELYQEFRKPTLFQGVLDQYELHANGAKAICYCVNIDQCEETAEHFRENGHNTFTVHSKSEDREDIIDGFGRADEGILFNVGIATTGYDEPSVQCIIQNFATAQVTKHHQTVGRGARTMDGKDGFTIIDMGRNYLRHGLYGEGLYGGRDVDWIEIFNNPKLAKTKKEETETSVLECSMCGAIVKAQLDACPYCQQKITHKEKEERILEVGTAKEIREYRVNTLPVHLRGLRPSQMSWSELEDYAKHMGYKEGWVRLQKAQPWRK